MATSYTNACGSGDRTAQIVVTLIPATPFGFPDALIQGSRTDTSVWWPSGQTSQILEFWFPSKKIIDEATWYQSTASTHGVWKWQGSNDRATWTDVGGTFTLGGATTSVQTTLAGNTTAYVFYRLFQVSGTTSSSPYLQEIEFKIDEGGTTSYLNPLGSGDRSATIGVTSSGITWQGSSNPVDLINGSYAQQVFWASAVNAGTWVQFDLGGSVLLQQARWRLTNGAGQGDWKLQGSPNASAWTDLTSVVAFGAADWPYLTSFGAATNTVAYRYYRFLGVSGSSSSSPYLLEVEFMVGLAGAGGGSTAETARPYVVLPL